jgi:hypothetical protein
MLFLFVRQLTYKVYDERAQVKGLAILVLAVDLHLVVVVISWLMACLWVDVVHVGTFFCKRLEDVVH